MCSNNFNQFQVELLQKELKQRHELLKDRSLVTDTNYSLATKLSETYAKIESEFHQLHEEMNALKMIKDKFLHCTSIAEYLEQKAKPSTFNNSLRLNSSTKMSIDMTPTFSRYYGNNQIHYINV